MAHSDDVHHDYHLVNPSPWPLVGSIAAVVWALGMVIAMKGLFGIPKGNLVVAGIGVLGILYTMFGWWSDVIKESREGDHTPVVSIGLRYGMILFIASEVMFFVAWFWVFFEMSAVPPRAHLSRPLTRCGPPGRSWPPKGVEVLDPWHFPLDQHPDRF